MSDIENTEIRICLIGEPNVGKHSIISRFRILNASNTVSWNNPLDISQTERKKTYSPAKYENSNRLYERNKNSKIQNEKVENTNSRINSNNNFAKIITVSKFRFDLKFFSIASAVIDFKDNKMKEEEEEDEELEKDHKLNFDKVKAGLEKVINLPTSVKGAELKILFLYVFDISNFTESFEKIKIYKTELKETIERKSFTFTSKSALIGNKVDSIPKNFDRREVNNFLNETSLKYYEISTKMFFSFEKFFEKIFFELFSDVNDELNSEYFRERFINVMSSRETFSKAARKSPKPNPYPSPQDYTSNVFDLNNLKNVFVNKETFNKKIFVNKTGPVFDHKKENFNNKRKKSDAKLMEGEFNKENQEKEEKEFFELERKKNKLKEDFFTERPGYSLGIKPGKLNLKKKKREELKRVIKNVDDLFGIKNIANEPVRRERKRSHEVEDLFHNKSQLSKISHKSFSLENKSNKKKKLPSLNLEKKLSHMMEKTNMNDMELPKMNQGVLKTNFTKKAEKEDSNLKKIIKFSLNETSHKNENIQSKPKTKRAKSTKTRIIKKEPFIVPAPNSYDIRGNFDPSKGFSFGSRHNHIENQNNTGPGFLSIPSDIDIMLSKPKFAAQKSYAPRFKEPPRIILGDVKEIEEKLKAMQQNRIRLAQEKIPKFEELERKRYEAMLRKEERENNIRLKYGYYDQVIPDINYNLVEETAPMYSIKGRYEKGFLTVDNNYEIGKLYGLDQSVTQLSKNINKDLIDLPKYDSVKPSFPAYSIPIAPRFEENEKLNVPAPNSYFKKEHNELLMKPGSKDQAYMGKSQRFQNKGSGIPGPGNYKISGFTDEVLKKASKKKQSLERSDGSYNQFQETKEKNRSEVSVMIDLLGNDRSRSENNEHGMDYEGEKIFN